jgi:hypothetical protein
MATAGYARRGRAAQMWALARENWPITAVIGVGALNVILLLAQLRSLVHALYRSPDVAVPLVISALSTTADTSRVIVLGNHPYYEAWWLESATRGLPGQWQIWEGMPFLIAFVGIGLMGWAAWQAFGPFAAAITTTVMLALGDAMRWILFSSDSHGYSVAHGALLVAALAFLAPRASQGRLSWRLLAGVGIPLAAISAIGATDQVFEFLFLPAFALAGCAMWWQHPDPLFRQLAIFCVAVTGTAILGAELLDVLMRHLHVIGAPYPISFVAASSVLSNIQLTLTSLAYLGGGSFFSQPVKGTQILVFAVGMLTLLGVLVALRLIWRYASSLGSRWSTRQALPDFYVAFWGLVVVLSLAAYLFTNIAQGEGDARYIVGVYAGVAAVIPTVVLRSTARKAALTIAVCVFGLLVAANHLIEGPPPTLERVSPTQAEAKAMYRFARAEGADHGYAGYWVAPVVSWQTRAKLKAYPVRPCGASLCPYFLGTVSTWYRPKPGVRTFLIADANQGIENDVSGGVTAFGPALASARFGTYTVLIYGHDIAVDLQ